MLYNWSYLPNPSARAGYDTRSIFKRSLTGLNSEFSFSLTSCLTKTEEHSLSYYLPIAGGRLIGFIPFPRVFVLCEMHSVSSRIWIRVAVSTSYDDNHYTTGTCYKIDLWLKISVLKLNICEIIKILEKKPWNSREISRVSLVSNITLWSSASIDSYVNHSINRRELCYSSIFKSIRENSFVDGQVLCFKRCHMRVERIFTQPIDESHDSIVGWLDFMVYQPL